MSQPVDLFRREQRPLLIVISGPSGAGKDAVVRELEKRGFYFVVTATDRPPRDNEIPGRDYDFYSPDGFKEMMRGDELLEYAYVYDHFKGVPKAHVREALTTGQDAVIRVDVRGAAMIKGWVPAAVTIFITCESQAELERRLRERGTESEEELQRRLEVALREMERIPYFDYVVVNRRDNLDQAVEEVLTIIRAEHCRALPREIHL